MNSDHFDDQVDDPIDARASAAADQMIASFADLDTEAALRNARTASATRPPAHTGRTRWIALAAAAVLVIGGTVALVATRSRTMSPSAATPTSVQSTIAPPNGPDVTTNTVGTTVPATTAPTVSTTASSTSVSATTVPETTTPTTTATAPPTSVASVSHLSPPPVLPIQPLATVTVPTAQEGGFSVAIGDTGVVLGQWPYDIGGSRRLYAISFDGEVRSIADVEDSNVLAYGPGDVAYLTHQGASNEEFAVVAIPLSGDNAGVAVATEPAGILQFLEYPPLSFGHGADGVVHRRDYLSGALVAPHVDPDGQPATLDTSPASFSAEYSSAGGSGFNVEVTSSTGTSWSLGIDAAPDRANSYLGDSPPVPGANGRGIYVTHLGPSADPTADFGEPTIWVMAVLRPDGDVTWWSLPDGWRVVASDIWGTVLARQTGTQLELALADLNTLAPCPNPPAFEPTTLPDAIAAELLPGDGGQIVIGTDGEIEPAQPINPDVFHYAGQPGVFINVYVGAAPGLNGTPSGILPLPVLGGSAILSEVEDGFAARVSQACGEYTFTAYGVSRADFEAFLEGLQHR